MSLRNDKGIALVLVLILALIGLAIVSALLFMATQSTQISGLFKAYRSAEEAGVGGAQIAAEFVEKNIYNAVTWGTVANTAAIFTFTGGVGDPCLIQKFTTTKGWTTASNWTACSSDRISLTPEVGYDLSFITPPSSDGRQYTVSAKIVDTVRGNTSESGLLASGVKLGGAGVVSASNTITPPPAPSLYRIDVVAWSTASREKAAFDILYAH